MNKVTLGTRYYNWEEDDGSVSELKVIKLLGGSKCRCMYTLGSNKDQIIEIKNDDLKNNYTQLRPDGFISFNISIMGGTDLRDVIVLLNKTSDITMGDSIPYCVCRQSINDAFALAINKKEFFGLSVSKDTCPADIDYVNYLASNGVEKFEAVAIYIGDKLKDILGLFNHKNFDAALYNLFVARCRYGSADNKYIIKQKMQKQYIDGYCKTLNDLLAINNFEYDFYRAFNITPINRDLSKYINEACPIDVINFLKITTKRNIDKSIIIPYDKSIDLSKIERKYVLVADANKDVYIVAYTDIGVYQTPVNTNNLKDIAYTEASKVYSEINFNLDKYN